MGEDRLTVRVVQPQGERVSEERMDAIRARIEWCKHTAMSEGRKGQRLLVEPPYPQIGPPELMVFDMEPMEMNCIGRHGVIRNVTVAEWKEVQYTITYYFGAVQKRGMWWQKQPNGTYSVEFYNTTKVLDGDNSKPWGWCGDTVLFNDQKVAFWAAQVKRVKHRARFEVGDTVTFEARGDYHTGTIISMRGTKRATVAVGRKQWYVPYAELVGGE